MSKAAARWLGITVALAAACAGSADSGGGGGTAKAVIAGRIFEVSNVELTLEPGDDGFFSIEGDDAANPETDCVPGLTGRLGLYGELPSSITTVADLAGQELPFEFSGDGDEANLCFVGSNGLLGVEAGTVRFTSVEGNRVTFTFSGRFTKYDGEGGESAAIPASGGGVAHLVR
jgi:hypothetical protein